MPEGNTALLNAAEKETNWKAVYILGPKERITIGDPRRLKVGRPPIPP